MASGPVSCADRPNTGPLRPALRRAQSLDSLEPSTHGPTRTWHQMPPSSAVERRADVVSVYEFTAKIISF